MLEDEPDNRVLECVMAASAAAVVMGDKDLLSLKVYEGIGIMTVADLLYLPAQTPASSPTRCTLWAILPPHTLYAGSDGN